MSYKLLLQLLISNIKIKIKNCKKFNFFVIFLFIYKGLNKYNHNNLANFIRVYTYIYYK